MMLLFFRELDILIFNIILARRFYQMKASSHTKAKSGPLYISGYPSKRKGS
jgi:hypothetical protein